MGSIVAAASPHRTPVLNPQLLPPRGSNDPFERVREALDSHGSKISSVKRTEFMAQCPAHRDNSPSLHVSTSSVGTVLLHCFAGCAVEAICEQIGVNVSELYADSGASGYRSSPSNPPVRSVVAAATVPSVAAVKPYKRHGRKEGEATVYAYRSVDGETVYEAVRIPQPDGGKTFRQRHTDSNGNVVGNLKGIQQIPYGLPELVSSPGEVVHVTEGEKDTNTLRRLGILAVSIPDGALSVPDNREYFRGRHVVIHQDNDDPGIIKAGKRAEFLYPVAASVRVMTYPDTAQGGDVTDWLTDGHGIDDLLEAVNVLDAWLPDGVEPVAEWPEPIPFDPLYGPPFPVECLPRNIGRYTQAVAASIGVPVDLAAVTVLGALSAAVGGKFEAGHSKYREPVHVMLVGVAPPASRKSGVFATILKPLQEWQRERNDMERPRLADWESKRRSLQQDLTRAEAPAKGNTEAVGDSDLMRRAAVSELMEHDESRPVLTEIVVDDITPQAAAERLIEQQGSLAVMSAESAFLENIAGRYDKSGSSDLNVFLQGHAGDALSVSRKGSVTSRIDRACLSLCILLQPEALMNTGGISGFHGRGGSARLLPAIPASVVGYRPTSVEAPEIPRELQDSWSETLRSLLDMRGQTDGPSILRLSSDALHAFSQFERECETSLRTATGHLAAWVGKQHGAALRLAGLLHLMDNDASDPIDEQTMKAAITLARWFRLHAEIMFRMMDSNGEENDAERVIEWLRTRGVESITVSDMWQSVRSWSGWQRSRLDGALDLLVDHLMVDLDTVSPGPAGGRPSKTILVNPKSPTRNTRNLQPPATEDRFLGFLVPNPEKSFQDFPSTEKEEGSNHLLENDTKNTRNLQQVTTSQESQMKPEVLDQPELDLDAFVAALLDMGDDELQRWVKDYEAKGLAEYTEAEAAFLQQAYARVTNNAANE